MMARAAKFKYVNLISGTFVLAAVILLVIGIYVTGRAKGWFEGEFVLHTWFKTEEGAFGLQEGSEVRIRNLSAGRVGKIYPDEQGRLVTTFIIRNRFKPLLRRDAVARVKKTLVITGDAYVEIEPGRAQPVTGGEWIECVKDTDLMDMAQKFVGDLQETLLPMLEDVKEILQHVNGIVRGLEEGKGLAGAILRDDALVVDARETIRSVQGLLDETKKSLLPVQQILADVERAIGPIQATVTQTLQTAENLVVGLERGDGTAGMVLKDPAFAAQVRKSLERANSLLRETQSTMVETTRLLQGIQRHWLLRRYVPHPKITYADFTLLEGLSRDELADYEEICRGKLQQALEADDAISSVSAAHDLTICLFLQGKNEEALRTLTTARLEAGAGQSDLLRLDLVEATWLHRQNKLQESLDLLTRTIQRGLAGVPAELIALAHLRIAILRCELSQFQEAEQHLKEASRLEKKIESPQVRAYLRQATGLLNLSQNRPALAAASFDQEAGLLREAGLFVAMAQALDRAARAYEAAGDWSAAVNRYYRAVRTLVASKALQKADEVLDRALPAAQKVGNEMIASEMSRLREKTRQGSGP
ncbi:MAG: MlaD family protein [Kiritimatiellia bacterium]